MEPKYYIGYSIDKEVRYKSSSGGIGTAIIKYLLSLPEYGTSITFYFDSITCSYKPKFIYSSSDINVCGSIYQDIDIPRFVSEHINEIKGGIVVSCMPCQVGVIRQILNRKQISNIIISLVCSGQTTIEGTWCYYKFLGIKKEDVVNMQYRGNGWPSGIQIWLKDGRKIYHDNYTEPWSTIHQSNLFKPKRCFFCTRDTNNKADISLADPWLKEYKEKDKIGHTLFVVHSKKGYDIIVNMRNKENISYIQSNYDSYYNAQKPNLGKAERLKNEKVYINNYLNRYKNKLYTRIFSSTYQMMKVHNKIENIVKKMNKFSLRKLYNKLYRIKLE